MSSLTFFICMFFIFFPVFRYSAQIYLLFHGICCTPFCRYLYFPFLFLFCSPMVMLFQLLLLSLSCWHFLKWGWPICHNLVNSTQEVDEGHWQRQLSAAEVTNIPSTLTLGHQFRSITGRRLTTIQFSRMCRALLVDFFSLTNVCLNFFSCWTDLIPIYWTIAVHLSECYLHTCMKTCIHLCVNVIPSWKLNLADLC